jgi:hypothetical protein
VKVSGIAVISCSVFKISSRKDFAVQIQPRHKLTASLEGIFLDGQLLHKCDLGELPERTLE